VNAIIPTTSFHINQNGYKNQTTFFFSLILTPSLVYTEKLKGSCFDLGNSDR
jgi:hypothetical protein